MTPRILIIAGSDSGGGAGIQADIKTVTMLGGHAMTAITAITAQNTLGVEAVHRVPANIVAQQMAAVVEDIGVDAIKIGMLGGADIVAEVTSQLGCGLYPRAIVLDPVMIATSGAILADDRTIAAMEQLGRLATVITPNLPELAVLCGREMSSVEIIEEEASLLAGRLGAAILVKGGHADGDVVIDRLIAADGSIARWENERIVTTSTHGTGCTLSSAIATGLGQGMTLADAVERAIRFVRRALEEAPDLGHGHGPMGQQYVTDFR
ncbi:bifunctional hydroxymethylpyrimidine kinase/phosphomethylpyrimidine kinase [Sphingomonas sp. So64.6b]|uniref:bifunctional hydroxymethylpyrimidine kinase/phosphomethylpyrimidine kinase n=1 Tax=Sphingomonas sp. So64.6b TaxID=2997354 RepID=UPI00160122C0|nr:bifunctional hydroxymethylpyrimidine kinase/phosphomethylpyrimidine kinase [Sphingomonas sp. So64.6b]QNA86494.1 bifunctional hydroxymethylpyrimidine kinase/phosphomethylpyrimidine kinase [Sphingomonas sp. So64.6b]